MGIQETTYSHKELLWQSFIALVDIILNGYCEQMDSIKYVCAVYIILQSLCVLIRDIDKRKEFNSLYEIERTRLLQQLTQVGLSNSVVSLAEKYHDFPTLFSLCESSTEGRSSEILHDYMIHFASEVSNGMVVVTVSKLNFSEGFYTICVPKIQRTRFVR